MSLTLASFCNRQKVSALYHGKRENLQMEDSLYAATVSAPAQVESTPAIGTQNVKSVKVSTPHQTFWNVADDWNRKR